jgi:hypothetical protein
LFLVVEEEGLRGIEEDVDGADQMSGDGISVFDIHDESMLEEASVSDIVCTDEIEIIRRDSDGVVFVDTKEATLALIEIITGEEAVIKDVVAKLANARSRRNVSGTLAGNESVGSASDSEGIRVEVLDKDGDVVALVVLVRVDGVDRIGQIINVMIMVMDIIVERSKVDCASLKASRGDLDVATVIGGSAASRTIDAASEDGREGSVSTIRINGEALRVTTSEGRNGVGIGIGVLSNGIARNTEIDVTRE